MPVEKALSIHMIVVGNEKGGSGKSTVAMHVAVGLMNAGHRVATIDLDPRQRSLTRYIENRRAWAAHIGRDLKMPAHLCFDPQLSSGTTEAEAAECAALTDAVVELAQDQDFVVIDTPGHYNHLMRLAHLMADTLITPLNDSFVDLDVLASVDPETLEVAGIGHYARLIEEARRERQLLGRAATDWIVLRNRLSTLGSRNKRVMGERLQDLSQELDFRCIEGLAERMIFREYYPRGLTALDDLDEVTIGTRPTLSHATARLEIENLLGAMRLGDAVEVGEIAGHERDAA